MSLPLFEHLTIYPKKDSTHICNLNGVQGEQKKKKETKEQYIHKSYNQEHFGQEMTEN